MISVEKGTEVWNKLEVEKGGKEEGTMVNETKKEGQKKVTAQGVMR